MHQRREGRQKRWAIGAVLAVGIGAVLASRTVAAPPPRAAADDAAPANQPAPPWAALADPQRMFDAFFGRESPEDRKRLEHIPVSLREEQEMGKAAVGAMLDALRRQNLRVTSRGKEAAYLRDLVETIRPHTQLDRRYRSIQVYYVDSDVCEARSFPGGTLFFFRGLLQTAENEAAVAGIVGHELSHLDRGHHLTRARRVKSLQEDKAGKRPGFDPEQFFSSGSQMLRLWTRPFQPEAEAEADLDGARWAYQAGYDPRAMAALLRTAAEKRPPRFPLPEFLQSHPPTDQRSRAILDLYEQLQRDEPKADLYLGKDNLRRRTAWKPPP